MCRALAVRPSTTRKKVIKLLIFFFPCVHVCACVPLIKDKDRQLTLREKTNKQKPHNKPCKEKGLDGPKVNTKFNSEITIKRYRSGLER